MTEQGKLAINLEKKINSIEEYKFEPIKGYPMLNWKGKRPFSSTQYYPAQLKESYGEEVNGWMNKIHPTIYFFSVTFFQLSWIILSGRKRSFPFPI